MEAVRPLPITKEKVFEFIKLLQPAMIPEPLETTYIIVKTTLQQRNDKN